MSSPYLKNIAIVGASGNIGRSIVTALLSLPTPPTITAFSRPDSSATFPSAVHVSKVSYNDHSALVSSLKGQQAVVVAIGFGAPFDVQSKLIEAAGEAGVEYFFPCEFGSDTNNDELVNALGPMMQAKQGYRKQIEKLGKSKWIGIANNPWTDYSLATGMFGISIPDRTATTFSNGARFNTTTLAQAGRVVAGIVALPESKLSIHANHIVFVNSFFVTQRELLDSVQRATNTTDADWSIDHKTVEERIAGGKEKVASGNHMGAVDILYGITMTKGLGDEYPEETVNKALGLPEEDLDEVVKKVVEDLEKEKGQ